MIPCAALIRAVIMKRKYNTSLVIGVFIPLLLEPLLCVTLDDGWNGVKHDCVLRVLSQHCD